MGTFGDSMHPDGDFFVQGSEKSCSLITVLQSCATGRQVCATYESLGLALHGRTLVAIHINMVLAPHTPTMKSIDDTMKWRPMVAMEAYV
jgi:hypothetical protein